jgi:hypothetical protein
MIAAVAEIPFVDPRKGTDVPPHRPPDLPVPPSRPDIEPDPGEPEVAPEPIEVPHSAENSAIFVTRQWSCSGSFHRPSP